MRRSQPSILLCIFALLLTCAQAQLSASAQTKDKAAIEQLLHDQETAWNKGDIDTFMHGYKDSPETTFIGKTVQQGYDPILRRYKTSYSTPEAMGKLDFTNYIIRMLGPDHAVVVGKYHLARTGSGGDDASGVYSLILEREREGWRIILDHTSASN